MSYQIETFVFYGVEVALPSGSEFIDTHQNINDEVIALNTGSHASGGLRSWVLLSESHNVIVGTYKDEVNSALPLSKLVSDNNTVLYWQTKIDNFIVEHNLLRAKDWCYSWVVGSIGY